MTPKNRTLARKNWTLREVGGGVKNDPKKSGIIYAFSLRLKTLFFGSTKHKNTILISMLKAELNQKFEKSRRN